MSDPISPKAFISYSWSSPEHEEWVLQLAESLMENGVEVELDKWALKEGHDTNRFMERMVNDASVTKVIIVSDKKYAAKANDRQGGVGTETQIISAEVYASVSEQNKFAVVVCEKDEAGNAYLPTYYKGRIYIDLTDSGDYPANFDKLLRWLYNKPLHVKPSRGETPAFLREGEHKTLGTSSHAKRIIEALSLSRPTALGALTEYFNVFNANLERFQIQHDSSKLIDDEVVESIDELLPAKNEFLSVVSSVAIYSTGSEFGERIHSFLENLYKHTAPKPNVGYHDENFDNILFLIHEIFVCSFAIFIKHRRIDLCMALLADYYVPEIAYTRNQPMATFEIHRPVLNSLEYRNQRLKLERSSVHADLLIQRLTGSGLTQEELIQADMILFFRGEALNTSWYPVTYVYLGSYSRPMEMFARAGSRQIFDRISPILGIATPEKFKEMIDQIEDGGFRLGRVRISFKAITSIAELAKKP